MMIRKSQFVGFLLAFFFGPIGLFYSSTVMAVIYIGFIGAAATSSTDPQVLTGVSSVTWILSIITSFITVSSHNKKVEMMRMMRR